MLKKLICGLVALSFGFSLLGADEAFVGTWKMNVAKSKFAKDHEAKEMTLVVAVEGDTAAVTINGTVGDGQTLSIKYTVPTAGGTINYTEGAPPAGTTDALKNIDDRTVEFTSTMNGNQILKQHIVVSADHKTMIIRESGVDEKGQAFKSVYVYDRQ
ncbi:MAG TPA: hypothetical protein VGL97_04865 [Bryobacteraceae bacterium]|jgi:hypothetical protein